MKQYISNKILETGVIRQINWKTNQQRIFNWSTVRKKTGVEKSR